MYIGCARTKEDISQAIALATKTFRSKGSFDDEVIKKSFLMFPDHERQLEDVIIIDSFIEILFLLRVHFCHQFVLKRFIAVKDCQNY